MHRRRLLRGCGLLLSGMLAGCRGDSGSEDGTPTATPTPTAKEVSLEDGGTDTDTPSPTPTPTETPPPTPTPTETPPPTPTAAGITHEIGERFTVGEGEDAVTYRLIEFARADRLGSEFNNSTADGTFLVVTVEVTNPQEDIITLPRNEFRTRSPSTWHKFDRDASEDIESDDRIDEPPLVNTSIRSGASERGAVAFDVNPGDSYRMWVFPTGPANTPEHFLEIGPISAVREL
ncbi:MAG: hypothetical protein BRD23_09220 [Halobacteriales archaeon SW_9_67_25]|jgi:hypothetical protein|nr:MAG: hypothetical protein BRD23_09220 [Halobacteriales archaeon SW_9_67_25]